MDNLHEIIYEVINNFKRNEYLKWKKNNVTYRGIKNRYEENGVSPSFGAGLYTVPLSNKQMARQYGKVYLVLNAKPQNPKIVQTLNDAEILRYRLVYNFCLENGLSDYDARYFDKNTSMEKEMIKLGYDGLIISGREMVNYLPPDNVKYFEDENELLYYYSDFVNIE